MRTGYYVILLGLGVSILGFLLFPSNWGYGIFGFGLAHIVLGALDLLRSPETAR